tara:strand:- start:106 stop:816 length:711 start_codon:yes stop_codon:yes gene_type:complete
MLCNKNDLLESRNFVDGVDFTRDDPCIFVVYPAGSAGDLLISIIDKHYLRTGCEYYGIADNGRVHMFTTDYESMDLYRQYEFNDQWFYDLATNLGNRNLNYSLLDQVIFGCHMHQESQIKYILDTFPCAKIIRIMPIDHTGAHLLKWLQNYKLKNTILPVNLAINQFNTDKFIHDRVFNLPFGSLFNEESYYKQYDSIIKFLNLNGRLICFDYVKYYMSKQHELIKSALAEYSDNL